ncbi:MAG: hypothetical protein K0S96_828, partial [Geminicoccaceae bacterium]|nr:hypothetical protein [Geminicoccaceae bacterium]
MRPLLRVVVAVLLVGLLLVAGLATALLWFPAPLLRAGLRAAGLEAAAFEELRLGPRSLELSGLRLGAPPDHRLARLQIRYRLGELLRGQVESVEIEGLELRGRIVDGRVELAGFESSGEPGEGGGLELLPWPREVVLRAAEVQLASPWGELRLPLTAELRPGAMASFQLEVSDGRLINDAGRLRVDLRLQGEAPLDRAVSIADVVASGAATVAAESFAVPRLAEGIDGQGEVAFELAGGRLELRLAPAELAVEALG